MKDSAKSTGWYLEGYVDRDKVPRRYELKSFPFRIGRSKRADATLPLEHISGFHAEFYEEDGRLWLRDLQSSNGTYLNGHRVTEDIPLSEGDIVHFAQCEFLVWVMPDETTDQTHTLLLNRPASAQRVAAVVDGFALRELLTRREVNPYYQPIVELASSHTAGFEILARGSREGLAITPGDLFEIAEKNGLATELSSLFRWEGIMAARELPGTPNIFVNTHPMEMQAEDFFKSFDRVRKQVPDMRVTVETHEATVTDPRAMQKFRSALSELDVELAYDDFGAGQARLLELVEVPPDYLKFDISLISDIDKASASRQKMLETLVHMVKDMGIACVAEGIERVDELEICVQMGFDYGQGFYLGRPAPVAAWLENRSSVTQSRDTPGKVAPR